MKRGVFQKKCPFFVESTAGLLKSETKDGEGDRWRTGRRELLHYCSARVDADSGVLQNKVAPACPLCDSPVTKFLASLPDEELRPRGLR